MRYFKKLELEYVDKNMHYLDVDFEENDIVEAQYIEVPGYEGNPDICALPLPATGTNALNRGIYYPQILENPDADADLRADSMRNIRIPMKNQGQINKKLYNGTVISYAGREYAITECPCSLEYKDEKINLNIKSRAYVHQTTLGSSIIGMPGTGKSTAVKIALKDWPRVILHKNEQGGHYIQIPVVWTTAYGCSNLTALFQEFAGVLDDFLDSDKLHLEQILKKRTIGHMALQIADWIQRYHIGTWIIEEISFFNFDSNHKNTFENIVTIIEKTGVFLFTTGNDDIFKKIQDNMRIERRIMADYINMNLIAQDKNFISLITKKLWARMLPEMQAEWTEKIFDTIYESTYGSIDLINILLISLQHQFILDQRNIGKSGKNIQIKINEKYIKKVADKKIAHMSELFKNGQIESVERYKKCREAFERTLMKEDISEQIDVVAQLEADVESGYDHHEKLQMVKKSLTDIFDQYTDKMIESAFCYVEKKTDGFRRKTDKEIKRLVLNRLKELENKQSKKKKNEAKANFDQMYQELASGGGILC